MKRTVLRAARLTGGVLFIILGVLGLFLPFLQGILFLVIGFSLLGKESERARQWSEWLRQRLPLQDRLRFGSSTSTHTTDEQGGEIAQGAQQDHAPAEQVSRAAAESSTADTPPTPPPKSHT